MTTYIWTANNSLILTDEALHKHVEKSARSEITLRDRGTFQGLITMDNKQWQIHTFAYDKPGQTVKPIPFHLGEITMLKPLIPI